ncbi:MAG TPA: DUF4010 domain-containing protein [Pyrinomonadaceae bacterium]|nr:DUF4010 domain-containing protein [Acidobacteriota bacterium]HQZ97007.1 DUF4010 domain-containing protein [Pyrinomonadaceae bacterium]
MDFLKEWVKPLVIISATFLIAWLLPEGPIDPWGIVSLRKAAYMVFALCFIQVFGSAMIRLIGGRKGSILTGFFGGLVSSTATTVSVARESSEDGDEFVGKELLMFLSATAGMLVEGIAFVLLSSDGNHYWLLFIFIGPLVTTAGIIILLVKKIPHRAIKIEDAEIKFLPILGLAALIIGVLAFSKFLQSIFGQSGLLLLTFLVSLFEIHGSVIANLQLRESGVFDYKFLGGLLATSVAASYISKLFLVNTIGSSAFKKRVTKYVMLILLSLLLSWMLFYLLA